MNRPLLLIAALLLANCAATTKLMPLGPHVASVGVPMQQTHLAEAARQAVAQSVGQLDYADLNGKVGRVQVSGVLQPPGDDTLAFIGTAAEGVMAERGVRIEPRRPSLAVLVTGPQALSPVVLPTPDFVLSLTVDAAGVDLTGTPQYTGPIALTASAGSLLLVSVASMFIGFPYYYSSSGGWLALGGVSGGLSLAALVSGLIWLANPPRQLVADSRVKLVATVQPTTAAIKSQQHPGAGQKTVKLERGAFVTSFPIP
jgi:hypothetical protein